MGCGCALLVPLMLLPLMAGQVAGPMMNFRMLVPMLGFYIMLAVLLVTLGVGSFQARRWARALTLVMSWFWLVTGIFTSIIMIGMSPNFQIAPPGQQIPPQMLVVMQFVFFGTIGCLYILLPGAFVAFYRSQRVKATCDFWDPQTRWTDHCPLPVLGLSLMLGYGAVAMLFSASYGFVMPLFGVFVKGIPGAVLVIGFSVLAGYLARATYRLKMSAWWTVLVLYLVMGVSSLVTFSQGGLVKFYREMDFPEEQIKMMEKTGMLEPVNQSLLFGAGFAVFIGYMLWIRKHFTVKPSLDHEGPV